MCKAGHKHHVHLLAYVVEHFHDCDRSFFELSSLFINQVIKVNLGFTQVFPKSDMDDVVRVNVSKVFRNINCSEPVFGFLDLLIPKDDLLIDHGLEDFKHVLQTVFVECMRTSFSFHSPVLVIGSK